MRHKWSTIKRKEERKKYNKVEYEDAIHAVSSIQKCVRCGLLKGYARSMSWSIPLVYFKDGKALSLNRLPFKCVDTVDLFLTEDDFKVR
jgi:hypothetical protein